MRGPMQKFADRFHMCGRPCMCKTHGAEAGAPEGNETLRDGTVRRRRGREYGGVETGGRGEPLAEDPRGVARSKRSPD